MKFFSERMRADSCMQQLDTIFDSFTPPMTNDLHRNIMYLLKDLESIRDKMKGYFYQNTDILIDSAPELSSRDKGDYEVYKYCIRLDNTIRFIKECLACAQEYDWEVVK